MPPIVAAFVYLGFVAWLFWRDVRQQRQVTSAIWIPFFWLTIIGSRFVSEWFGMFGLPLGAVNVEDGSPVDAVFFGVLIIAGLGVLRQRRVTLAAIIRNNRWMTLFLAYCFVSILWSDFPFVALKRLLKVLGHPIMVLVVLSEQDPEEAVIRLLKRCTFVWVPISILFIKYFPQWGRSFDEWTGQPSNSGITYAKNMLGLDCFIVGAFLLWYLIKVWRMDRNKERRNELVLVAAFLGMVGWLLHISQSSTSLVSSLIAVSIIVFVSQRWVNPRYIGVYLLIVVTTGVLAEEVFGIYTGIIRLLGKNPSLTDRTFVWQDLLQMKINPVLGTGFESFWLGDRLKILWAKWWWRPNEAHNAYLETYLNLGLVGLFLLLGWFGVIYKKAQQNLINRVDWGSFRLAFLVASLFYGWTEAAFRAQDPVYFLIYLIAIDYPKPQTLAVGNPVRKIKSTGQIDPGSTPQVDIEAQGGSLCHAFSHNLSRA